MAVVPFIATEHEEQKALIQYCQMKGYPWNRIFSIPNGGDRHPAVAGKLKAEGVRPGVPDTMLPVANPQYHGLFIEMKRRKKSKTSQAQVDEIEALKAEGYCVIVAKGWEEAVEYLKLYLSL